jgi:hypothetical protein
VGSFQRRRRWNRRFWEVHKHQILRSLTLSEARPGAYSSYKGLTWLILLYFIACDVLCITCMVSLDGGDRLQGSTLLYTILDVVVLLLQLDVLCLIDSHC